MKTRILLFALAFISLSMHAQNPTRFPNGIQLTTTEDDNATQVIVRDAATGVLRHVLKTSIKSPIAKVNVSGTVKTTTDVEDPFVYNTIETDAKFGLKENVSNKQNSLTTDGTGLKYPTVDAINNLIVNETTGLFSNIQLLINANPIGTTINLKPNAIYTQDNALVLKDRNVLNMNGATLKRGAQQTTATTASCNETSNTIQVSSVPAGWKSGDYLQLYSNNTFLNSSYKYEVIILSIAGNTITLSQPIGRPANGLTKTWAIGTTVRKVFSQITGSRSEDLFTSAVNYKLFNGVIDGNKTQNTGSYYWGVNMAVMSNGRSTLENIKFKDIPNECIFGSGFNVFNCVAEELNGSFYHQSADITVGQSILGGEIHGNTTINTNLIDSETVTGHSEGVITFSFTSGRSAIFGNRFIGGNESVLGIISYALDAKDGSNQDLIFEKNTAYNFQSVIKDFIYASNFSKNVDNVLIRNNSFVNCGINDFSPSQSAINSFGTIKFYGNELINGTTVANVPQKMQNYLPLTGGTLTGSLTATNFKGNFSTIDLRSIKPSDLANSLVNFGFCGYNNTNSSPYADFIHFNSYTDASGGNQNLITISKNGFGIRLWQKAFASTSNYDSFVELIHNSNIGSYALPITGGTVTGVITGVGGTALNNLAPRSQLLNNTLNKSANYTVVLGDFPNNNELILFVDTTSGNVTVTLPAFATFLNYTILIKKVDASANSITVSGNANIDQAATLIISGLNGKAKITASSTKYETI